MAVVYSVAIPNTKIKFRYGEPYASTGANIQMGVNRKGVYKGGIVEETSPSPSTSVRISISGGETIVLHEDTAAGIRTVIRETSNIELDLGGETWPIPAGGKTYYVYATVDYDTTSTTTGAFEVSDAIPSGTLLATIELAEAATEITDSDIKTDGTNRDKSIWETGVAVLRQTQIPAVPSTTRFQLLGRIPFINAASARTRMTLCDDSDIFTPLVGSDGGQIVPGDWYAGAVGGVALVSGDMDEDGCYTNPYVEMDFADTIDSDYDAAFRVLHYKFTELEDLDGEDWNGLMTGVHANDVWTKEDTGSPDSLTATKLDTLITQVLGLINNRIRIVNPNAADATWKLIWRSNNITADANVDRDTLSLYWINQGLMLAQGGYIGNDGAWKMFVPAGSSTGNVYAISIDDGTITYRWKNVSAVPAEMVLATEGDWDSYDTRSSTASAFQEVARTYTWEEIATAIMQSTADDGGNEKYLEILRVADGNIRVYWGGAANFDLCQFMICFGCLWNDAAGAAGLWQKSSVTNMDARAIQVSPAAVNILRKDENDANYSSGWTENEWSTSWSFATIGSPGKAILRASGTQEKVVVPFKFVLKEEYVRAMRDVAYVGPLLYAGFSLRAKWNTTPATISFTKLHSGENTLATLSASLISDGENWGGKAQGQVENITSHLETLTLYTVSNCFVKTYTLDYNTLASGPFVVGSAISWHDGSGEIVRVTDDRIFNSSEGTLEITVSAGNPPSLSDTLTSGGVTADQNGELRDSGRIYIVGSSAPNLVVGQALGVRGTINGAWTIKEFLYEGTARSTIVVDCEGGANPMTDGDDGDGTVYYLDYDAAGTEITAFYLMTVEE